MAYNVFGTPVTNSTLEGMPEYVGKQIRPIDRATVALSMKNAENKDFNVRKHVEQMKEIWGTGVSTLCVIYNATGDTLTYATSHNWYGHIGPAPYPAMIANGQWGAFLHVKTSGASSGSNAAVVYHGKNAAGDKRDWMLAWSNPWDRSSHDNKVYTEVREEKHYEKENHWDYISSLVNNSKIQHSDSWGGCLSTMSTGSDTSPIVEGILMLEDA